MPGLGTSALRRERSIPASFDIELGEKWQLPGL